MGKRLLRVVVALLAVLLGVVSFFQGRDNDPGPASPPVHDELSGEQASDSAISDVPRRISSRLRSDQVQTHAYFGSVVFQTQEDMMRVFREDPGLLSGIPAQMRQQETVHFNLQQVGTGWQLRPRVPGEFARQATYVNAQKLLIDERQLLIHQGAFLLPHIVGHNISLTATGNDLLLTIDNWNDNSLLLRSPLEQPVHREMTRAPTISLWQDDLRLFTFGPSNRVGSREITYDEQQLDGEQLHFLSPHSDREGSAYTGLQYTAMTQLLYPDRSYQLTLSRAQPALSFAQEKLTLVRVDDEKSIGFNQQFFSAQLPAILSGRSDLAHVVRTLSGVQQGTNLQFGFTTPTTDGSYFLVYRDQAGYQYLFPFELTDSFGLHVVNNRDELLLTASANFPFKKETFRAGLTRLFGSEEHYTIRRYDNALVEISYQIVPEKVYSGSIQVENIYGQSSSFDLSVEIEEIPAKFRTTKVAGEHINLLPVYGYRGDRFQVSHRNESIFTLYFEPCELIKPELEQDQGAILEDYLLQCGGKKVSRKFDFSTGSDYWTTYRQEIEIPREIDDYKYFRVSMEPTMEASSYFVRSDISLLTKVTDKELYVWSMSLHHGELYEQGTVSLYDLRNERQLATQSIKSGLARFDLRDLETDLLLVETAYNNDSNFVVVERQGSQRVYVADASRNLYKNLEIAASINPYEFYQETPRYWWGGNEQMKLYGYTDRALYQPGDTVSFAGFVRNMRQLATSGAIPDGTVTVRLSNINGEEIDQTTVRRLDRFGGFSGSFALRDDLALGQYYMMYEFDGGSLYSHEIRVEEYQKPTFSVDSELLLRDGSYYLRLDPTYYFGGSLSAYDLSVDYTITTKETCRYCRRRNEDDYYFNQVFDQTINTGDAVTVLNYTGGDVMIPLFAPSKLAHRGADASLKATVNIIDRLSDEVQQTTLYHDIPAGAQVGLSGQPHERVTSDQLDRFRVTGRIDATRKAIDTITYQWYYQPFERDYQYGVDGNRYYIQGRQYAPIASGDLHGRAFTVPTSIQTGGNYFLRVLAFDENGNVLGENQKQVSYYQRDSEIGWHGTMPNNYTLTVNIPKKSYGSGEEIPIEIEPYISGATALVTVERGRQLLYQTSTVLDESTLSVPVRSSWYPNVNISVMQLAGETISPAEKRKEPRFFIGYAQAELAEELVTLDITVQPDKTSYQPGETMNLRITTTDSAGRPVESRVSISVVDQALIDLYRQVKEPIPYFYNTVGSAVGTYTNLKFLYQLLRVFSADGEKGGGGSDGEFQPLGTLREYFADVAYRDASVVTEGGQALVTVPLPDNLTTWMIDLIGITTGTKIGTTTINIRVEQPFLLEPNLPVFVTLGDQLQIPVKVVVNEELLAEIGKQAPVTVTGKLQAGSEMFPLETVQVRPNSKAVIPITVPPDLYGNEQVVLELTARSDTHRDSVRQTIPLRAEGFIRHDYHFANRAEGEQTFVFDQPYQFAEVTASISVLPATAFEKAFTYLLTFPYGCTEQVLSSLYPIAAAQQLNEQGLLSAQFVEQGKVQLPDQPGMDERSTDERIRHGLQELLTHQQDDGGFAYWEAGESVYSLSAYVYGGLLMYQQHGYEIPAAAIANVRDYLRQRGGESDDVIYLYSLWQAAQHAPETVRAGEVSTLISDDPYSRILGFATLAALGETSQARELLSSIDLTTLPERQPTYSVYLDDLTVRAIYIRGILALGELRDQEGQVVQQTLLSLLKERDEQGKRGRSTQRNVQVLLAIADYMQWLRLSGDQIACTVKIGPAQEEFTFPLEASRTFTRELVKGDDIPVSWACNQQLFVDIAVRSLPKDLQSTQQLVGLDEFTITTPKAAIGEQVTVEGRFSTKQDASQVAVAWYIPADLKFIETISARDGDQVRRTPWKYGTRVQPFAVEGSSVCQPSHWEVWFDRLFLYYNHLPAGSDCSVSIQAIQAYSGTTNTMPSRLREMYNTQVWGQTGSP